MTYRLAADRGRDAASVPGKARGHELFGGDRLCSAVAERMRETADHFLGAHLPETRAPAIPVGKHLGRPFAPA